mmetsp:Transcript_1837/g.5853  ORF Transcript_1837/g.5853 Transcript_1837/m.5853 type:complete len:225 (+) Transcript_1837:1552-2226(+)
MMRSLPATRWIVPLASNSRATCVRSRSRISSNWRCRGNGTTCPRSAFSTQCPRDARVAPVAYRPAKRRGPHAWYVRNPSRYNANMLPRRCCGVLCENPESSRECQRPSRKFRSDDEKWSCIKSRVRKGPVLVGSAADAVRDRSSSEGTSTDPSASPVAIPEFAMPALSASAARLHAKKTATLAAISEYMMMGFPVASADSPASSFLPQLPPLYRSSETCGEDST